MLLMRSMAATVTNNDTTVQQSAKEPDRLAMIVSHRHKFIFMKTMKTASSSMEIALSQLLGPDDILTPAREDLDVMRKGGPGGQNYRSVHPDVPRIPMWRKLLRRPERYYHPTVGFYEHMPAWRARRYLGEQIWQSYYKFSFERNPWDRQVSFYHYKTRDIPKTRRPTFEQFLAKGKRAQVTNWDIYTIDNEVVLDFVGRYENIDADFEKALGRIGLSEKISLPKANVTQSKPNARRYQDYYTDETRALVAGWSGGEIKHFGYEF